jgi:NAD(P)H-flavin reductase/ferredoxin
MQEKRTMQSNDAEIVLDSDRPPSSKGTERKCHVSLSNGQDSFEVGRNELLLMAALEQGINYPHTCRVGTCGRCKTKLIQGRISPLVDFALSPLTNQELRDGYILACQAKVRSDLTIDVGLINHKVVLPQAIPGEICAWKKLPGGVIDVRVRLEKPLVFEAGQYAALAVSGSFVRRCFSFYDAPAGGAGNDEVGFLIKHLPGGRFSEWMATKNRCGVRIWMEAPFGQMGLDDTPRDALCVAGGTGIAPILSIAEDRLNRYAESSVTIVFGVRTAADLFALDRLERLKSIGAGRVRIVPIVSQEPSDSVWKGQRGLVTDVLNERLGIDWGAVSAFLCGAPPMVEMAEKRLLALGAHPSLIHADKFESSEI